MSEARILTPEEWQKLDGLELGRLLSYVRPENIAVLDVEDESGHPIACMSALQAVHFEGFWMSPEHRGNAGVLRSLMRLAYGLPRSRGEAWVMATTRYDDDRMAEIISRLGGTQAPVDTWILPVRSY